jgi:PAS domain S-box-containing protein
MNYSSDGIAMGLKTGFFEITGKMPIKSEPKYQTIADFGHILIWAAGPDKQCGYFDAPWLRFTSDISDQKLAGGWTERVHPDDFDRCRNIFHTAFDNREKFCMEYRLRHACGEYCWLQDEGVPRFDDSGTFLGFIGLSMDITDHKRVDKALHDSEKHFRLITETISEVFWMADIHINTMLYISPGYEKIWGRTVKSLYDNPQSFIDAIHVEDRKRIYTALVVQKNKQPFDHEYRIIRPDGEMRWIWDRGFPVMEETGQINLYIGIAQDITERKKADEEKAKLEARLLLAQKMEAIGLLAGGIAHDLNNILFPISGLSEMLLGLIPSENPWHRSIEQIYKSAQRGSDLVKQILAFTRRSDLQKIPIRIQPILKEVLNLSRATIPTTIKITNHIMTDCGLVAADPTQVHQILMNLITNAYHAVDHTGGTIHVALKESLFENVDLYDNTMKPGKYACMTVHDTGIGIDRSVIDKIFTPYFTTKEQGKGTGIGLSVVREIVKEHGGDIRVYSEAGKGTAFHVYLPIVEDVKAGKNAAVTRKYPTGHENILMVDDEEPIAHMVQVMLEGLGYRLTVRTSSPDALAAFKDNPDGFDLVISDRSMPHLTGIHLAAELISIRPNIPIIICTGLTDENEQQSATAMGVKGFLAKPVAISDLAVLVRKVLDEAAANVI